jgi:BirA family transcriptional regulator, biotin operon repressor / biotin---[acetyl-CoA-carboxylase] ligase
VTYDPRAPLSAAGLRAVLPAPWTAIDVVAVTGSTNADLRDAPAGSVLVAEYQNAGRGRLDRSWVSPPGAGLIFSAVVEPTTAPTAAWGWLPLLTGVAVHDAVLAVTGRRVGLKWPNDVLIDGRKLAGILVQASGAKAIIGVGLNVTTTRAELPVDTATSLIETGGGEVDRAGLLIAILAELGSQLQRWTDAAGDVVTTGQADAYRARCTTIGRRVSVVTEAGARSATALGVGDDGQLQVRWDEPGLGGLREQTVAAGDIVHLRVD